jgi:hypothetical protein
VKIREQYGITQIANFNVVDFNLAVQKRFETTMEPTNKEESRNCRIEKIIIQQY